MLTIHKVLAAIGLSGLLVFSTFRMVDITSGSYSPDDPDYCTSHHKGDQAGCLADHEHSCVWCTAKAVKSACYNAEVAKQLPHSIFNCSEPSVQPQVLIE